MYFTYFNHKRTVEPLDPFVPHSAVLCSAVSCSAVSCSIVLDREWYRKLGCDIGLGGEVANVGALRRVYRRMAALDTTGED